MTDILDLQADIDTTFAQTIHPIYAVLHREVARRGKIGNAVQVLSEAAYVTPWAWRIVGITPAALGLIADNGFRATSGVHRGHFRKRADTVREALLRPEPMALAEFQKHWLDNDRTVLMTAAENRVHAVPDYIAFDNPGGSVIPAWDRSYGHTASAEALFRQLSDCNP